MILDSDDEICKMLNPKARLNEKILEKLGWKKHYDRFLGHSYIWWSHDNYQGEISEIYKGTDLYRYKHLSWSHVCSTIKDLIEINENA